MILVRYIVELPPGHEEFGRAGGAQANLFVDCDDPKEAEARAVTYLNEEKCRVVELMRIDRLRRDADQHPDKDTRQWIEAARERGIFGWFLYVPKEASNPNPLS